MGLSSAQVKFFQYTDRKHAIGRTLNRLASDKLDLTRDMNKASRKYQEDLNRKILKWSPNSGVTYVDLSYNNLMKPSQMNGNTAYLLTDSAGKVVVDYGYKKYAEMISSNGASGGNWEAKRSAILSQLVGVPEANIDGVEAAATEAQAKLAALEAVKKDKPSTSAFEATDDLCCVLEKYVGSDLGSSGAKFTNNAKNWGDAYQHGARINLGSGDPGTALKNLGKVLGDKLSKIFVSESTDFDPKQSPIHEAIELLLTNQTKENIDNGDSSLVVKEDNNYYLDVKAFINAIILEAGVESTDTTDGMSVTYYDTSSGKIDDYLDEKEAWEDELSVAQAEYEAAMSKSNSLLTADQERQIDFYDDLFSTIAEKGWTYNDSVSDVNYLNEMLQNNIYTITTVDRNKVKNENSFTEDYFWENTYNTEIAVNCTNIFAVNDSDARERAQVEYENTKSIINEKETKIDTRMQILKTEQESINTMLQSLQSIIDENIEDKFNLFA